MADKSNIAWTNSTWNPWMGCHKVSAGCKNCYMFRDMPRYGRDPNKVVRAADSSFNNPLKWANSNKVASDSKIFTCSWSDWFVEEADEWRGDAWEIVKNTPFTYLILTKRVKNILQRLPSDWGAGYPNVWLGFTTEDQMTFNNRIEDFLKVPAALKFVSVEPMLTAIDFSSALYVCPECGARPPSSMFYISEYNGWRWNGSRWEHYHGYPQGHVEVIPDAKIDWIIFGGESDYKNARPMEIGWVRYGIDQCKDTGVAPFVKQMGTVYAKKYGLKSWKGENIEEWPVDVQIQQFPR